jgi:signal transduction histidine kinase
MRIGAHVIEVSGRHFSEVVVEDSGPGVETNMQQRIFEPFFTTKAAGIGLGLAVVKRIAEAHQGEVLVRPSSLGGAAFVLRWPLQVRGDA